MCQTLTRILVGVFVISITFEIDVISTTPSPEKKLLFKVWNSYASITPTAFLCTFATVFENLPKKSHSTWRLMRSNSVTRQVNFKQCALLSIIFWKHYFTVTQHSIFALKIILYYKVTTKFITYPKQTELHYRKKVKLAWK